jgi:RHS repeat-associated protein
MTRDKLLLLANDILPGGPDQRFYASTYGRFNTPDPYQASAKGANNPNKPGSWNHYAYAGGDPVNRVDPTGQLWAEVCGGFGDEGEGSAEPCGEPVDPLCGNLLNGDPEPGCSYTVPEQPVAQPQPQCSISLYERSAGGSPGNHTYLDVSETLGGATVLNDVLEGNPTNKSHPPFRNPISKGWPPLYGYIEPVFPGATFNGSTNPATNSLVETDTGANICADISVLLNAINAYDSGTLARYMPIPGNGFYNSNSFTYTLLGDVGLENPGGSNVFPEPPGWNPGWGKPVPGLVLP